MKKILVMCLSLWVVLSCEDPYKNENFQLVDTYPTSTYLSMREDLSLWVDILHYADLYNAINEASESFTVFVPDNEAVTKFYSEKGVSSIEQLGYDYARDLVKFHTLGSAIEQEVFLLGGRLSIPTLSEDYYTVTFDTTGLTGGGLNGVYINEEAQVNELAIETNNGFVYVLDGVLTPLVESIYDRLKENNDYSIMREAIELTRWSERLDQVYDTTYSSWGSMTILKRNFTLLTVSNSVFAGDGITSVESLISKIGAASDYTNQENKLYRYIGYHLLNSSQFEEDLFAFSVGDSSKLWNTNADNGVLGTYLRDGKYYVNYTSETHTGVQLVAGKTDILARNGVLHEINNYMPEINPDPEVYIWDLCAYDEVISFVNAYGAENELGDIYNVTQDAELYLEMDELTDIYTVGQRTVSSTNTWKRGVIYHTEKNGGYNYNLKDGLFINVGYMGYVEMTSPIVLKGKYLVELVYASASTLGPLVTAGGSLLRFNLDSYMNDAYMFVGAPSSGVSINTMEVFSEVEFTETTTHTFRITVMDPKASTESYYRLQVDYVKFTPID